MIDRYRNYQPRYQTIQPRKHHHFGRLFLFAILLAGGAVFGKSIFKQQHDATPRVTAATIEKPKVAVKVEPIATTTWDQLSQQVEAIIAEHDDLDISVAIADITSNTKASYGFQDNFAGASTTKVLTAVTYLDQVQKQKRSLSQTIGSMTAKQHLKQMINQSNNDSWSALNTNLTYATIENYARSIGIQSYQAKNNIITASDEALLLQKLYQRTLLSEDNTTLLLSYMQQTNNEAMIPQVIPDGAVLYHKYGQLEDRLHDAAIIDYQNRPIVVVIYTKGGASDGSNYQSRVALIRQIAQTIFDIIYPTAP
ncbi:MAG: serine hydrolase [Candidatus Saccharimonadales bacterium]